MYPFQFEEFQPGGSGGTPSVPESPIPAVVRAPEKNSFQIFIDGIEYSQFIVYPVNVVKKSREESLNLSTIILNRMTNSAPFKPNTEVRVVFKSNKTTVETQYFLLLNDVTKKIGYLNKYEHVLSLIEYTHVLEQIILPDFTFTRNIDLVSGQTLYDVALRVLNLIKEVSGLEFMIAPATLNILSNIESPEWTFNRFTALETLRMIFSMAKIVPFMSNFTNISHVDAFSTATETLQGFSKIEEAYDPQTFKTALYSNVNNFIAGQEKSVIEPADGWMTPRSNTGYEISNDYALIPTSKPIYKIKSLKVFYQLHWIHLTGSGIIDQEILPYDIIPEHYYNNELLEHVYEKTLYDILPNTDGSTTINGETVWGKGKAFKYTQGQKNIENITNVPASPGFWSPTVQAYKKILDDRYGTQVILDQRLQNFIKPEYLSAARTILHNLGYVEGDLGNGERKGFDIANLNLTDLPNMRFKIEYVPFIDTNLFTYRERKDTSFNEVPSFQYYNQQANVLDNEVLGEIHDQVTKKGSGSGVNVTYLHKKQSNFLTIGSRILDYIITSASFNYFQYGIKVVYNLDQFYTKLQQYAAVLEQYRQFSIPNENIVNRQKTFNVFAKFSDAREGHTTSLLSIGDYLGNKENVEINLFKMSDNTITINTGYVIPTSNFAFNNSLVFEASFESNSSVGFESVVASTKRANKPINYTDKDGRINADRIFLFGRNFNTTLDLDDSNELPYHTGAFKRMVFLKTTSLFKDAREKLSVSLQIHHVDTVGKIYINKEFARYSGLIGGEGYSELHYGIFRVKPHNGAKIASADIIQALDATVVLEISSIKLPTMQNFSNQAGVAHGLFKLEASGNHTVLYWADETIAVNETTPQYYINFDEHY